ncbi:MAG: UDP-N-acetylmuramoyl-L-alanyl-D-glutamate--2,6-diaminopimelate ligase [bacterium]|nr:UDP-N-acetylmuramoyl-L-alanyl-D-glutamate--2,6-diaminopimelate ligase [bacterium]
MNNLKKEFKTRWWRAKSFLARYYYGDPSKKLKIIGVTGTNGKTTTATLLHQIATGLGYKAGLIGTAGNIIINEKRESTHTTPDSISLTKLFAEMLDAGCEYVFMEVSSHALDQGRVKGVHFVGGIFTNLTHDHLDYHKSLENYFLAKKKFFKMLSPEAWALSNADDGHGEMMLENIKAKPYLYGFSDAGRLDTTLDFKGEIIQLDFDGLKLKFNDENVNSKLLGKFNACNLLSVWSTSKLLGFDMVKVNKIIETITPPAGRFEFFKAGNGAVVIVDYAHTPDALEKVLSTAKEFNTHGGNIISVFGCGGDRDPMKRRIMGKLGATLSDIAIFTSDNPRSENPDKIIAEMKTDLSMHEVKKVQTIPNRREAIEESAKLSKKGDIILCAGKGHETYQEIKGVKHHFNDMEEFRKAFQK